MCNRSPFKPLQLLAREQPDARPSCLSTKAAQLGPPTPLLCSSRWHVCPAARPLFFFSSTPARPVPHPAAARTRTHRPRGQAPDSTSWHGRRAKRPSPCAPGFSPFGSYVRHREGKSEEMEKKEGRRGVSARVATAPPYRVEDREARAARELEEAVHERVEAGVEQGHTTATTHRDAVTSPTLPRRSHGHAYIADPR
jgi:hypothetical protein